jgi:arginyl-tRNA synthetase
MNVFALVAEKLTATVTAMIGAGELPADLDLARIAVEVPRDPSHGDVASNLAMVLAKPAGMKPRDLAEAIGARLSADPDIAGVEVAGPGFLNLRLIDDIWLEVLAAILQQGDKFGDSQMGAGRRVVIEYVSANPTGPLHAAHARGAVVGDALAALLSKAGFDILKEYYTNDAGAQVDVLARSTFLRYREALGQAIDAIPDGYYPGEYLKEVGAAVAARDGAKWLSAPEADWLPEIRAFAIAYLMDEIRGDLAYLGVEIESFISERSFVDAGGVDEAFQVLQDNGLLYRGVLEPPKGKKPDDWEPREQTLFKATQFGDDVDRPLQKSDGSWTYFANDIANHLGKFRRGYPEMINIWGADHSGYVKRMKSAVAAVTDGQGALDIKICQLVHMMNNGKPVRMSKRAGTFVTLRDVIDAVGKDVIRFIMLTRRNDQSMAFDFAKVQEQSRDNPVFYVQYAHARAASVLRHVSALPTDTADRDAWLCQFDRQRLTAPDEIALIKVLASWPRVIEGAADSHEPHRIAFYLGDVAAAFHSLWNRGKDDARLRFIIDDDAALTTARLALVRASQSVIASGLRLIGVEPVEEM